MRNVLVVAALALVGVACQPFLPPTPPDAAGAVVPAPASSAASVVAATAEPGDAVIRARKPDVPPVPAEVAPPASPRLGEAKAKDLDQKVQAYFAGHAGTRVYVQVDKPMYQPGETIWVKSWDLRARTLANDVADGSVTYELINPKGAVVLSKLVREQRGTGTNDFEIPADAVGGEYTLRVTAPDGTRGERPVIVNTYEPPRIKKKLEFVRKAYGAGDEVTATVEVKRPTGEAMANLPLTAAVRLDGQDLPRVKLTTDRMGEGLVRFKLPDQIEIGDGLLTVLVEDGGITESVSKSIPIVLKKVQFSFFPEGGQMVAGLPGRLYFEAKNTLGKPADVEGRVVDQVGNAVATFSTHKNGLGRMAFTPGTGKTYHAEILKPVGVVEKYPLPLAAESGCVLRAFDDLDGELTAVRVAVQCSQAQDVVVTAFQRESLLDSAVVKVTEGVPAVVHLEPRDNVMKRAQGIARVTVLDESYAPLAERLVYRNRRAGMKVDVRAHRPTYSPREQVTLAVTTTGGGGQPVAAELAMSVVDDTVVSFADDKTGHMLSRLFLEPEFADKVEEPNFYFDLSEEKSALAMDLLVGTRGWRRFEWQQVLNPPRPTVATSKGMALEGAGGAMAVDMMAAMPADKAELREVAAEAVLGAMDDEAPVRRGGERARPQRAMPPPPAAAPPQPAAPRMAVAAPAPPAPAKPMAQPVARAEAPAEPQAEVAHEKKKDMAAGRAMPVGKVADAIARARAAKGLQERKPMAIADRDMAEENVAFAKEQAMGWAPVRVFPAPSYRGDHAGPRTDFRETIHWQPNVRTGADGKATVTFYLSDAITSFRIFTEGVGSGMAGRDEAVVQSKLPFSMTVKLPLEVSAGDKVLMPLTLSNEKDRPLDVELDASFGELLSLDKPAEGGQPKLAAGARHSVFYPLTVTGQKGHSKVGFFASAGGLKDEFTRDVVVTPLGFPQQASWSGRVSGTESREFDLGDVVAGSAEATIKVYPSPVATMISGLEGMLREPSGCFEQTSSTNYPNVMVMTYLKEHDIADSRLVERSQKLMDSGYRRLVGFETPQKGYEWFGGAPGHEALTAYGILEFADMKRVYPDVDDAMVKRTAAWLKGRRDGKGGYLRDPKALDSFGSAAPEVTNAYITYSLTEAGILDFPEEIDAQSKVAAETKDEYLLALATNTMLNVPARKSEGVKAAGRLAALQGKDGAWVRADHSITRSTGSNLHIETTALAVMALLKTGAHRGEVEKGVAWMQNNRGGFGQWGATQATVLALKAMTRYAQANRKMDAPGAVTVTINGSPAGEVRYEAGSREPVTITADAKLFRTGKNTIALVHKGKDAVPFTVGVDYRAVKPATSPQCSVDLKTSLERTEVKMGENVRANVVVTNKTAGGLPMTLARVGIPGGLAFQTWQLKELKEKGLIAFYETNPREVILYFRDMKPSEAKSLPLDLVATVPGEYTAPASSAYLYYTNDHKTWVDALKAKVVP
jgi:hypothetical protein